MRYMKKILLIIIITGLFTPNIILSQGIEKKENNLSNFEIESRYLYYNTSDGVMIYKQGCCKGYTLIGVQNGLYFSRAKLVNMKGKIVNRWFNIFPFPVKMLTDGEILVGQRRAKRQRQKEQDDQLWSPKMSDVAPPNVYIDMMSLDKARRRKIILKAV